MNLHGKVAIVTGGGRDIGKAISIKLAAEGAKVIINYSKCFEKATETLNEIKAAGGEAAMVQGDVTKQAHVDRLIAETVKAYGNEIHILVNVAGGLVARKTLDEMDVDFFTYVLNLNLTSTFIVTKAVVPYMKSGASIINLSSQAGRDGGGAGSTAYATSKGGLMTFTRSLAKELGPKNIRVNSVCPGMIATTFHDTFTKNEVRTNVAAATPLRREGRLKKLPM
jgi:3-oxoacyl-[acyl-carrier protein] reductase